MSFLENLGFEYTNLCYDIVALALSQGLTSTFIQLRRSFNLALKWRVAQVEHN